MDKKDKKECPICGTKLFLNEIGDEVCPNCGIISFSNKVIKSKPKYV